MVTVEVPVVPSPNTCTYVTPIWPLPTADLRPVLVPLVLVWFTTKVPGPETVAVRAADPVVATLDANGVTVIVAAPAVVLPADTLTVAAVEPVAANP